MSDEKTTALAAPVTAIPTRSLLNELAGQAGLDPTKYYAMLKEVCGCREAKDEHFAALMLVAQGVGLNPVMAQMYLVPTQKGVKPVIGVDGYLVFLNRALKDGLVEWYDYEDGWWTDPRKDPTKNETRRGGKVTMKFRNREKPVVHIEWLDEVVRDTGPWKQHQARMLRHKSVSQAVRYNLGLYVPDAEEAGAVADEPRRVAAEVSDTPRHANPVMDIPTLGKSTPPAKVIDAAPAPLDAPDPMVRASPAMSDIPAQQQVSVAPVVETLEGIERSPEKPWAPTAEEEAEIRAQEKRDAGLFGNE